jgi:hypothetical protein
MPIGVNTTVAVVSPQVLTEFMRELASYPKPKLKFVIEGIRDGFNVGWEPTRVSLHSRSTNMARSASEHPEVVDEYLAKEVSARRVAGPFDTPPVSHLHISPFGVIPKKTSTRQMASYPGPVVSPRYVIV